MTREVEVFFEKLGNWEKQFSQVTYDHEKYCGDTADIFRMQAEKDVSGLSSFWQEKGGEDNFELMHPTESVKTRAVHSVQHGMANFVFLVDKSGQNLWIIAQCELFINLAITQNTIYRNSYGNAAPIFSQLSKLADLNANYLTFKEMDFGFLLSQTRPYHFFYDQLKVLLSLDSAKFVANSKSFFYLRDAEILDKHSQVFFFPNTIGNNYLNQKSNATIKKANEHMEETVYKKSMLIFDLVVGGSNEIYDLVIWLGVTGQKRSWLQQVDGYVEIIIQLKKEFPAIIVYIDGMTATDGSTLSNLEDEVVFDQIREALENEKGVELVSLIGQDYRTKICHCDTTDIFIANAGTGCMVPLRFNKKPGVLHSNHKLFTFPDNYPDSVKRTAKNLTIDLDLDDSQRPDFLSYHIPWQHIFNLTAEVLNQTKGTNIELLKVPSVKEVSKTYEVQVNLKTNDLTALKSLENRIQPNYESPDILREVALAFELSGDIVTALSVMQAALKLRPNGPLIKKKAAEYEERLKR